MSKLSILVLIVFFCVAAFHCISGCSRLDSDISGVRNMAESIDWPRTDAVITGMSVVETRSGKSRMTYTPKVAYTYSVNGRSYEGTRLAYDGAFYGLTADRHAIDAIAEHFPVGSHHTARYSPKNEGDAVIVPGVPKHVIIPAISSIFVAIMFIPLGFAVAFFGTRRGSSVLNRVYLVVTFGIVFIASMLIEGFVKDRILAAMAPEKSIMQLNRDGYVLGRERFSYGVTELLNKRWILYDSKLK